MQFRAEEKRDELTSTEKLSDTMEFENEEFKRSQILSQGLSPILKLLKIFGLYYEIDRTKPEGNTLFKKCLMFYCYGIFFFLLYTFVKSIVGECYCQIL